MIDLADEVILKLDGYKLLFQGEITAGKCCYFEGWKGWKRTPLSSGACSEDLSIFVSEDEESFVYVCSNHHQDVTNESYKCL